VSGLGIISEPIIDRLTLADRMEALLQAAPAPPPISPPELPSFSTNGALPFSYMHSTSTYALSSSQGFNDWPQASNLASANEGLSFDPTNLFGTGNSPSFFGQPFDPTAILGSTAFDASFISSVEATFSFDTSMPSTSTELLPFGWPGDVSLLSFVFFDPKLTLPLGSFLHLRSS